MSNVATSTNRKKSNLRDLAEYIYASGHADEIMAALEIVLAAVPADEFRKLGRKQEEGAKA